MKIVGGVLTRCQIGWENSVHIFLPDCFSMKSFVLRNVFNF